MILTLLSQTFLVFFVQFLIFKHALVQRSLINWTLFCGKRLKIQYLYSPTISKTLY